MWQQNAASLQEIRGVRRGRVISVEPDGVILVSAETDAELVSCRILRTGSTAPTVDLGDQVVYLMLEDDAAEGYILGVLASGEAAGRDASSAKAFNEETQELPARLVLESREEVVLRTGRATIILRSNGDVEIRGKRIVSRAGELQKLSAPMLKLN
jgi:hypothetical protein